MCAPCVSVSCFFGFCPMARDSNTCSLRNPYKNRGRAGSRSKTKPLMITKIFSLLGASVLAVSALVSCSENQVDDFFKKIVKAPPSSIERDVKGHDQIYAVHAILRMGHRGGSIEVGPNGDQDLEVYRTYHLSGDSLSLPVMQEIDIAKDDDGQMTVTTARNHFDVVASDDIVYGLELRYYDQNGLLINHQFSSYYYKTDKNGNSVPDDISSALQMHQHFFGIGHGTLDQNATVAAGTAPIVEKGLQMAYPRTLDATPRYLDRFTFREKNGAPVPATKFSASNIYARPQLTLGNNTVPYDNELAWRAIETTGRADALRPFTTSDGRQVQLYQTVESSRLNELAPELFSYEYRDTDPVEEEVGKLFVESYNDDFLDPATNTARQRYSHTVGLLRQQRSLDPGTPFDRLGFKGIVRFEKSDVQFSLQVRICNILNKGTQQAGAANETSTKPAKYTNVANMSKGYVWEFNQIQPGWDNFDIDYPLPIRVIADTRDGETQCINDILRFYPQANRNALWRMLSQPESFFAQRRFRESTVLF